MKTITGQWVEAPEGGLLLELERQHEIHGGQVFAPRCYWIPFGAVGEIEPDTKIWGNDEIMPEGSTYKMTIFDQAAKLLFGPLHFPLCGPSPLNLNRMIQSKLQATGFTTFGVESAQVFGIPNAQIPVLIWTVPYSCVFPVNFNSPTSYATAHHQATAPAVFTVQLNGTAVGTITFNPTGLVNFNTPGFSCAAGDRLVVMPTDPEDATLSDVAITLMYTRLT